jgi:hypothetical protein
MPDQSKDGPTNPSRSEEISTDLISHGDSVYSIEEDWTRQGKTLYIRRTDRETGALTGREIIKAKASLDAYTLYLSNHTRNSGDDRSAKAQAAAAAAGEASRRTFEMIAENEFLDCTEGVAKRAQAVAAKRAAREE